MIKTWLLQMHTCEEWLWEMREDWRWPSTVEESVDNGVEQGWTKAGQCAWCGSIEFSD